MSKEDYDTTIFEDEMVIMRKEYEKMQQTISERDATIKEMRECLEMALDVLMIRHSDKSASELIHQCLAKINKEN